MGLRFLALAGIRITAFNNIGVLGGASGGRPAPVGYTKALKLIHGSRRSPGEHASVFLLE